MSSVRIDGSKIKAIRERQGLTQLYLATVVGVTTDTISRWENKHYSAIKRDNGEKLAEALEVTLEELLEQQEPESAPQVQVGSQESEPTALKRGGALFFRKYRVGLAVLFSLLLAGIIVMQLKPVSMEISCRRIAPLHSAPNVPFPVVIHIEAESEQDLPILIRETLTGEASAWVREPGNPRKEFGKKPRWIGTLIDGRARFTYQVTPAVDQQLSGSILFTGEIMTRKGQKTGNKVGGATSVGIAPYHWADADKDYRISDNEILIAYETYSLPGKPTLDFSALEELWLAGRYRWNAEAASFETTNQTLSEE